MCGIAGFMRLSRSALDLPSPAILDAMTDALAHRGPDSRGTWHDEGRGVGLGHRRLSIRDLSPLGAQPMTSSCGRLVLIFNGEIYSHSEIAAELAATGRPLKGTSDTEIMVEAMAEWGVEAVLPKLIGQFAIAVYDRETGALTLARDRLGIKPLYWANMQGVLMFGSELKPLREIPGWSPQIDRGALAAYMRHNYIPAPHTIYKGVAKLEPGCLLVADAKGRIESQRYWELRPIVETAIGERTDGSSDCERELDELDSLLSDAVERRMVSDVPLGCLLSGGIDSSLVTALMQENASAPINSFSIGFSEQGFDEAPFAKRIADHLGTNHTELYVEPDHALSLVDRLPHWYDEPFADSSQIPTLMVCELTKRHVTVVLSGDGGDELFAGYNRYHIGLDMWRRAGLAPTVVRKAIAHGLLRQPERRLDALGRLLPQRYRRNQMGDKIHKFAHAILHEDPDDMYRRMITHWPDPEAVVIAGHEPKGILWDETVRQSVPDFLDRMQFLDTVTYLPDDILTKVDRASMAVSLEARVPLIDHRVVEKAWAMPQSMKLRNGEAKWALRQLLLRRVPRELIERPKMGFGVPLGDWLRGPLKDWAENLLDEKRLREQNLFAVAPIRGRWQDHLDGANWSYSLWNVLMAQAWLDANPGVG